MPPLHSARRSSNDGCNGARQRLTGAAATAYCESATTAAAALEARIELKIHFVLTSLQLLFASRQSEATGDSADPLMDRRKPLLA